MADDPELKVFLLVVKDEFKHEFKPEWAVAVAETPSCARMLAQRPQVIASTKQVGKEVSVAFNPWLKEHSVIHDITRKFPKLLAKGKRLVKSECLSIEFCREDIFPEDTIED